MARSIAARKKGDAYQATFCWLQLLRLRTSDIVKEVEFESDEISFVDDIVVRYSQAQLDRVTGERFETDYFQCKYHMTAQGAFSGENLMDPTFIHTKESMLQRLHSAYQRLLQQSQPFRLYVVSNWPWHPEDALAPFLQSDFIRKAFYTCKSPKNVVRLREAMAKHLKISEAELQSFLNVVRFRLGESQDHLVQLLDSQLKLAQLKPIDPARSIIEYDDLLWKLFEQGRNHFDQASFKQLVHDEKLTASLPLQYSEISICSRPQFARRPHELQAAHLDLCDLFDERFPHLEGCWTREIPRRLESFLFDSAIQELAQPIHLFFDCHLSIAFLAGFLLQRKFGLGIVPAQKAPHVGYEFWSEPSDIRQNLWNLTGPELVESEQIVVGLSVTHPITHHLRSYLSQLGMETLPQIMASPLNGTGPRAIANGTHAWQLGHELSLLLRERIAASCRKIHLFFAVPAAFAYILGNTLRGVTPFIQLYEHDFEGDSSSSRYYPSILLPNGHQRGK